MCVLEQRIIGDQALAASAARRTGLLFEAHAISAKRCGGTAHCSRAAVTPSERSSNHQDECAEQLAGRGARVFSVRASRSVDRADSAASVSVVSGQQLRARRLAQSDIRVEMWRLLSSASAKHRGGGARGVGPSRLVLASSAAYASRARDRGGSASSRQANGAEPYSRVRAVAPPRGHLLPSQFRNRNASRVRIHSPACTRSFAQHRMRP